MSWKGESKKILERSTGNTYSDSLRKRVLNAPNQLESVDRLADFTYVLSKEDVLTLGKAILEMAEKNKNSRMYVQGLNKIAVYYYMADEYKKCDSVLRISIQKATASNEKQGLTAAYNQLGDMFRVSGAYDSALVYLQKALKLARSEKYGAEEISALSAVADVHRLQSKRALARKELTQVLTMARKERSYNKMAFVLNALGQLNNFSNNKPLALAQYLEAYKLAEKTGNQNMAIWCMATIGEINGSMNNLEKSEEAFLKALEMARKKGDMYQIAYCEGSLAQVYEQRGEFDKSAALYRAALQKSSNMGDKIRMAHCLTALGSDYYRKHQPDSAIGYFKRAKLIAEETQNGNAYTSACSGLSRAYRDQRKLDLSLAEGLNALNVGQLMDDDLEVQEAAQELHQTYAAMNRIDKAYDMHLLYARMKDSTSKYDDVRKFANAEYTAKAERLALEQKQKEAVHKANEAKKEAELNQQKTFRNALIGFAVVLLLLSGVIYRSLKQSQKAKQIITEKNMIIEARQKEIVDSIHYAKRIQDALLPSEKYIRKHLGE